MRIKRKQSGLSLIGWMALLSMIGIITLSALKMMPAYMEFYTIKSIINNMHDEPALKGQSKAIILDTFQKRLSVSSVTAITRGTYKITKVKGKNSFMIDVAYESRKKLFGNLSLVAAFAYEAEVGG